jgi:hypothetical protein
VGFTPTPRDLVIFYCLIRLAFGTYFARRHTMSEQHNDYSSIVGTEVNMRREYEGYSGSLCRSVTLD